MSATPELPLFPPLLESMLVTGQTAKPDGETIPLHSNISRSEATRLGRVVRQLAPETSLEIGFAQGVSALTILQAVASAGRGQHHIMDPFQGRWDYVGISNVERSGLSRWLQFHEKFAEEVIPQLPPIQFAFVDSSHLFDHTIAEFVMIDKKLEPGGVIGFHDLWMPALRAALRYFLTNRHYRVFAEAGATAARVPALRKIVSRMLRVLPKSASLFRDEILHPDPEYGLGENMVFLEKLKADDREWTFHRHF